MRTLAGVPDGVADVDFQMVGNEVVHMSARAKRAKVRANEDEEGSSEAVRAS
jgi:hypothetical protein